MRFRIMAIFLAVVFVFSFRCTEAGIKKEAPDFVFEEFLKCNDTGDSEEDRARKKLFESYLDPLDENNPAAVNIINSLRKILFLAKPVGFSEVGMRVIETLEAFEDSKFIPVVPMLNGDEKIGPEWEIEIKGPTFMQDPPMLIVKEEKISSFWKKLSMLHEGSHVFSFAVKAFESIEDPLDKKVVDEYCAYTLIFEILDKKGGEEYKKILFEKAILIREQFLKDKSYLPPDFSEAGRLNGAFAEPPLSPDEIHLRWQVLWIHSTFVAMEQLNVDSKEKERAKMKYIFILFENQFEE